MQLLLVSQLDRKLHRAGDKSRVLVWIWYSKFWFCECQPLSDFFIFVLEKGCFEEPDSDTFFCSSGWRIQITRSRPVAAAKLEKSVATATLLEFMLFYWIASRAKKLIHWSCQNHLTYALLQLTFKQCCRPHLWSLLEHLGALHQVTTLLTS